MFIFKSKLSALVKMFITIGVIGLIVAAAWFIHIQQFIPSAISTTGTVSEILTELEGEGDITYVPEIQLEDRQGHIRTLQTIISCNEGDHVVGEKYPILYDPQNSAHATIATFWEMYIGVLAVAMVSLLMLLAGYICLHLLKKDESDKQMLLNQGQIIHAKITDIVHSAVIKRRGYTPWIITASWLNPKDQKNYEFNSEIFWSEAKPELGFDSITVYIDTQNPEHYYMPIPGITDLSGNT